MFHYALYFLIFALVAGFLGFGGIAGTAANLAQILFYVGLALFVITVLINLISRGKPR